MRFEGRHVGSKVSRGSRCAGQEAGFAAFSHPETKMGSKEYSPGKDIAVRYPRTGDVSLTKTSEESEAGLGGIGP